jgi:hypothetical protein
MSAPVSILTSRDAPMLDLVLVPASARFREFQRLAVMLGFVE